MSLTLDTVLAYRFPFLHGIITMIVLILHYLYCSVFSETFDFVIYIDRKIYPKIDPNDFQFQLLATLKIV